MGEVNRAVIEQLREAVGREAFVEIASDFVKDARRLESNLRNAVAHGDADGARSCAHELRGLAATFGADRLVESCVAANAAGNAALHEARKTAELCASARQTIERFLREKGRGAA